MKNSLQLLHLLGYEKQETLIRRYFFKDDFILFVEVTPYIQHSW